jgi:hypothetical protein
MILRLLSHLKPVVRLHLDSCDLEQYWPTFAFSLFPQNSNGINVISFRPQRTSFVFHYHENRMVFDSNFCDRKPFGNIPSHVAQPAFCDLL